MAVQTKKPAPILTAPPLGESDTPQAKAKFLDFRKGIANKQRQNGPDAANRKGGAA